MINLGKSKSHRNVNAEYLKELGFEFKYDTWVKDDKYIIDTTLSLSHDHFKKIVNKILEFGNFPSCDYKSIIKEEQRDKSRYSDAMNYRLPGSCGTRR